MSLWAGFELWVPPSAPDNDGLPRFEIIGTTCQIVQFPLNPGQAITSEPGAMCYMNNGCRLQIKTGGLMSMLGSAFGGESPWKCIYTNNTQGPGYVAMTTDIPGVIVPIDMSSIDGTLRCKRGAWVCSTGDQETQVLAGFNPAKSMAGQCCGGLSFILQELQGGEWSFLSAMGTVITRELSAGEEIIVDTNSILAMTGNIEVDVRQVGDCGAMCCAGEGAFNTVLTGPGKVWLQSMPIEKLRALFPTPSKPRSGGDGGGDGGGGD
mmetsp:Transcript_11925/g.24386  ORF Transcript_11925/g.24386 Transcript_11925/m.24386 type:complete len:265 (+) Transcript_11925:57-851(+)|eukprot:CAMPEP_0118661462 /NCGR_PEP_ID=MMETSP0785-20121206/16294_1 /TAXON_ID=91992 /ORGANISM="Bolidomonas pacifica, Strain CCMP 1866" /LENGTH=264 /DNA_ID=CAMNT_0006554907 /DNA_START=20 /DNA_END=814 /DNA_ORIENTATION=+